VESRVDAVFAFLSDTERLKLVDRRAYVSDGSRHENSAEHSWHMAVLLLTIARELDVAFDLAKALRMALIHDLCEIDAGDISVYDPGRAAISTAELACIDRLATHDAAGAADQAEPGAGDQSARPGPGPGDLCLDAQADRRSCRERLAAGRIKGGAGDYRRLFT
jgi:hypothetical protein